MSDEERAIAIMSLCSSGSERAKIVAGVAAAIVACRAGEREECAKVALDWAEKGDGYDIAAAIRARKL